MDKPVDVLVNGEILDGGRRVVMVPDVVGIPFHVDRHIPADAGVALASPDPDCLVGLHSN
jgi:hypothetical protein